MFGATEASKETVPVPDCGDGLASRSLFARRANLLVLHDGFLAASGVTWLIRLSFCGAASFGNSFRRLNTAGCCPVAFVSANPWVGPDEAPTFLTDDSWGLKEAAQQSNKDPHQREQVEDLYLMIRVIRSLKLLNSKNRCEHADIPKHLGEQLFLSNVDKVVERACS